jgi:hypothetical protein
MLDQTRTMLNHGGALDDHRVRESARRLFERLNPPVRIGPDAGPLAVYDWEIARDTGIGLGAVRSALRLLDGRAVVLGTVNLGTVNEEHQVTALTDL